MPTPLAVVPLMADLGAVAGQRLVLLSLERYDDFADLRFARIDVGATKPLPRRVPPADRWEVGDTSGRRYTAVDAVGRGDRSFSNGEVRVVPPPPAGITMTVRVALLPDEPPLQATVELTG